MQTDSEGPKVKVKLCVETDDGRTEYHEVDEPTSDMALPLIFRVVNMAMATRRDEITVLQHAMGLIGDFMRLASGGGRNG